MTQAKKSSGPGRMVQDVTFFQTELRKRANSLVDEIQRLQTELEKENRENSNYEMFEKRSDALAEELTSLQGQLGDYNTLVDKLHTDTDIDELERQSQALKAKNQRESKVLDKIFEDRQQKERELKEIQRLFEIEQQAAESQIYQLDETKRQKYMQLKKENQAYIAQITVKQQDIDRLEANVSQMRKEVMGDQMKERAVLLYERLNEAKVKNSDLEALVKSFGNESAAEEKARLLEQVKQDNLEISGMERKITELNEEFRNLKDTIAQIDGNDPNAGKRR